MKTPINLLRRIGMDLGCRLSDWGSALFNRTYEGSEQEREDVDDGLFDNLDPDTLSPSTRALLEQGQSTEGCCVTFEPRGEMFAIIIRPDSVGRSTTTMVTRQTVSEFRTAADLFLNAEEKS